MSLKLKHILNAFENNQKVRYFDEKRCKWHTCEIVEVRRDECFISDGEMEFEVSFYEIVIISRPLSDLTKFCKDLGFVPIEWFEIRDDENGSLEYDYGNIKLIRSLESLAKNGFVNDTNYLPYGVVQKLHEWHFDTDNLIEKGLAIDINTL